MKMRNLIEDIKMLPPKILDAEIYIKGQDGTIVPMHGILGGMTANGRNIAIFLADLHFPGLNLDYSDLEVDINFADKLN
jgi:hypothetical protein